MTDETAIQYIMSVMSNYMTPDYVDKRDSSYRMCSIWLSKYDMEAFNLAIKALAERGKMRLIDAVPMETIEAMRNDIDAIDLPQRYNSAEECFAFCQALEQVEEILDEYFGVRR